MNLLKILTASFPVNWYTIQIFLYDKFK